MEVNKKPDNLDSSDLIFKIVSNYWKPILLVCTLSIVLSSIFSSSAFITPLFKSEVILYPTASKSISKALLSELNGVSKDILEFGEEEQTEQMLQVLNSNQIRDRIIAKYNLLNHYGVSSSSQYKMTSLYDQYESNFRFKRTEFMAIQITVLDRDPQMAADMANNIAELVDSTINQMQKELAIQAFKIVESAYQNILDEVKAKEDSLTVLRGLGVHDYESQSEMFNRQLAIEMAKGNESGVQRLEQRLNILSKYGGAYVSIRDALEYDKKQLSQIKSKYEEAKVDATENLPHKFIINHAYKAEKKSYPVRWLIVVVSLMVSFSTSMFFFGVLAIHPKWIGIFMKKNDHVVVHQTLKGNNSSEIYINPNLVAHHAVGVVKRSN